MGVRITPYLTVDYIRGLFVIVRFIAWVWLYVASRCVFSTAVAYALSKVGKEGLVLKKEQLQLYVTCIMVRMCFCGFQPGLESLYATKSYRFCSTINLGLEIVQC